MKSQILKMMTLLVAIIFSLSSCMTTSTMQDARTLGKGKTQANVGVSRIDYSLADNDGGTIQRKGFVGEVDVRRGVTDKLDVGLKVALLGTSGAYAKYQFLGDQESRFAASAGAGLGRIAISTTGTSGEEHKTTITDFSVPVNLSYYPTNWLSLYASPRYTMRRTTGTGEATNTHWYGATGGLRIGKKFGGILEYSIYDSKDTDAPIGQFTGGLSFTF